MAWSDFATELFGQNGRTTKDEVPGEFHEVARFCPGQGGSILTEAIDSPMSTTSGWAATARGRALAKVAKGGSVACQRQSWRFLGSLNVRSKLLRQELNVGFHQHILLMAWDMADSQIFSEQRVPS